MTRTLDSLRWRAAGTPSCLSRNRAPATGATSLGAGTKFQSVAQRQSSGLQNRRFWVQILAGWPPSRTLPATLGADLSAKPSAIGLTGAGGNFKVA